MHIFTGTAKCPKISIPLRHMSKDSSERLSYLDVVRIMCTIIIRESRTPVFEARQRGGPRTHLFEMRQRSFTEIILQRSFFRRNEEGL